MKIILDAMGGDLAPQAPVMGAVRAAKDFGAQITLVGRGEEILKVLKDNGIHDLPEGIIISDAEEVVDMHDDPGSVIHKIGGEGRVPVLIVLHVPGKLVNDGTDHFQVSQFLRANIWQKPL